MAIKDILLPLVGERTLLQQAALRVAGAPGFAAPLVIATSPAPVGNRPVTRRSVGCPYFPWGSSARRSSGGAVGMSAGGCLAAVLGLRYPKLFAGVFVHSGVACGAASAPLTAMRVLTYGADTNYEKIGANARADAPRRALPVALLAIGGADDAVIVVDLLRKTLGHFRDDLPRIRRQALAQPRCGALGRTHERQR